MDFLKLNPMPSKNELQVLLRYETETGFLFWKKTNKRAGSMPKYTCLKHCQYRRITVSRVAYIEHRIIYQLHYGDLTTQDAIDHIDRNKLNNKIENLRKADVYLNNQNQGDRKNNTSGYKGVSWSKQRQQWRATITVKNKHKHIGFFICKEKAYEAYLGARVKYYGSAC